MKKNELKDYIKSRIRETLYAGQQATAIAQKTPAFGKLSSNDRQTVVKKLQSGGTVELEEMARKAGIFNIDPDYREKAASIKTGGPISPVKLKNVLDFLDGKETTTGPEIAAGVGYKGEMSRIYPIYAALINKGALIQTAEDKIVDVPDTPENDEMEDSEEFENNPTDADIEKRDIAIDPIGKAAASFLIDNARTIESIIRSYKDSRTRLGEAIRDNDDLSAEDFKKAMQQSKDSSITRLNREIEELVDQIKTLEPAVQEKVLSMLDFKFKSVDASNVLKLIAKKLGKEISLEEPTNISADIEDIDIEDIDDEEITEDVEDIDNDDASFKDYNSVYERMQKLIKYKG